MTRASSRRRVRQAREGGYVLILVLAMIVILTAAGAALYRASESQRWALGAVSADSLALARANMGAQRMLARLRQGTLALEGSATRETCTNADEQGENATFPIDNATTPFGCQWVYIHERSPDENDPVTLRPVHLYSTRVYLRNIEGLSQDRIVIDSIGYVGKDPATPVTSGTDGITAARVEIEIESPIPEGTNRVAGGS